MKRTLDVFSRKVLKMIKEGDQGWEDMLPEGIAEIIKREKLFGFKPGSKFTLKNKKKLLQLSLGSFFTFLLNLFFEK